MEKALKDEIMKAAEAFYKSQGISAAELARRADVNSSYFSVAANGNYTFNTTVLKDSFFKAIAKCINYPLEKSYWHHVDTDQYDQAIDKLEEAYRDRCFNTIIGETGVGKTYSVRKFIEAHSLDTILVTVNNLDDIYSILSEVARQVGASIEGRRRSMWLRTVVAKIEQLSREGRQLILIIDEGENTKVPGLKAYKAIYDALVGDHKICGMALIATPELIAMIENLIRLEKEGIRQFNRRMLAGITYLVPIDKKFNEFLDAQGIVDNGLRTLLINISRNYGELHDYLERAIRCADNEGVELTEDYFRIIYNITTPTNGKPRN